MDTKENKNPRMFQKQEMADDDTIDLLELFFAILNHWKLLILIMVICGGAAGAYNHFLIKPTYQADAEIYITNTDTMINIQDVQLSAELTVDYEEIIRSRTVLKKVISELELDMTYRELSQLITIENPSDSHILKIFVKTGEPELSMKIANCLLKYGIDRIYKVVGNDEPAIIDVAEADAIVVLKPGLAKYGMMGALAGAFVVCALIVLGVLLDQTLKTEEDVVQHMGVTVIAAIPEYSDEEEDEFSVRERKKKKKLKKKQRGFV